MSIIDFRTQILPGMNGGCKDIETVIEILEENKKQGIEYMVATPIFDPWKENISGFIKKRKEAYEQISKYNKRGYPIIELGAEVLFFEGISRMVDLDKLCIEGSDILLITMPKGKWKNSYIEELKSIKNKGYNIVILGIEEGLKIKSNKGLIRQIYAEHYTVETDAKSIINIFTRKKILELIRKNKVQIIGSNCKDVRKRKPNLKKARMIIKKRLGDDTIDGVDTFGTTFFYDILKKQQ